MLGPEIQKINLYSQKFSFKKFLEPEINSQKNFRKQEISSEKILEPKAHPKKF